MAGQQDIQATIKERFNELPKVIQDAITSADVEKHLRDLANTHKLHVDQWESLENEVMMTLFGITPVDQLKSGIQTNVGIPDETATALAQDISQTVFEPIRQELERQLANPDAKAKEETGVEAARQAELAQHQDSEMQRTEAQGALPPPPASAPATPIPSPVTPPQAAPNGIVARAPISEAYKAGEVSTARKTVDNDPYREPVA